MADENADIYLQAYGCRALGQVLLAREEQQAAAEVFTQAIALFAEQKLLNEVQKTEQIAEQAGHKLNSTNPI